MGHQRHGEAQGGGVQVDRVDPPAGADRGRLPQLGKGIGEGIRNFKQSIRGDEPGDDNNKKA